MLAQNAGSQFPLPPPDLQGRAGYADAGLGRWIDAVLREIEREVSDPTIIVMTTSTTEHNSAVTLREDVQPAHLESEHHAAQLIERLGWAVADAEAGEAERS